MYPLISVFIIVVGALLLVFANKIIKNKLFFGFNIINQVKTQYGKTAAA